MLLFSAAMLSLTGWAARRAMRKYGATRLMESSSRRRRPASRRRARRGRSKGAVEGSATWRLSDRIGLAICWALGLLFCAIAVAIVVYLLIQGIKYLRPSMLVTPADVGLQREPERRLLRRSGRHPDRRRDGRSRSPCRPGSAIAVWLVEYGRPAALARITESTIEAIAGIPSIVLALFGTVIFSSTALGFLSRTSEGVVFGRSFFAASAMLSLVALPLVVASTREGLRVDPPARAGGLLRGRQDEGRDDAAHPAADAPPAGGDRGDARPRPDHRRHRDHRRPARAPPRTSPRSAAPSRFDYLRGAGTTLTNFVYEASPTGNLNQPQKAYAAAFVLLLMVLALNAAVDVVHRRSQKGRDMEFVTPPPPPIRRLELEDAPTARQVAPPAHAANGTGTASPARRLHRGAPLDRRAPVLDPPHGGRRPLGLLRRNARR